MRKKATSRKVTVKNGRFVAAVRESVAIRKDSHTRIVENARSSGMIRTVVEMNEGKSISR